MYGDQGDGAYSAGVSCPGDRATRTPSYLYPKPHTAAPLVPLKRPLTPSQRGGVGNIGSPRVRPTSKVPHDAEMIPELAVRGSTDENYHTGVRLPFFVF